MLYLFIHSSIHSFIYLSIKLNNIITSESPVFQPETTSNSAPVVVILGTSQPFNALLRKSCAHPTPDVTTVCSLGAG